MARLNRAAIPPRITTSAFLLGFLLLAGAAFAPSAEAAPTARFTASPVQGAACVAPCAVHLDATATTSTDHARPFHELDYTWECGEPTAGLWPTRLGGDKNRPRGPISGCIYDTPGTKTIRLTVREPDGQTSTTTSTVTVATPLAQYGASNIWCFRAGATGDFRGCPLDADNDGVCELDTGGHCATQASFSTALQTCGATTTKRGCFFRAGDQFSGGGVGLSANGAGPGTISRFGSGANPIVTDMRSNISFQDRWTVAHLDLRFLNTSGLFGVPQGVSNITAFDVRARNIYGACLATATGPADRHNDLLAVMQVDCQSWAGSGTAVSGFFLRAERSLIMGSRHDSQGTGEFVIRTVHQYKSAIQHNDLLNPGDSDNRSDPRNPVQIRSWATAQNPGPPVAKPTQYVVSSDNWLNWSGGIVGFGHNGFRTCQNNNCTPNSSGGGEGSPQDMVDLLFERNFMTFNGQSPEAHLWAGGFWLQGGRMTVRNNVLDLQGMSSAGNLNRFAFHVANFSNCTNCVDDEIVVQGNALYWPEATDNGMRLCVDSSGGSGHVCQLNLVYAPNDRGSKVETEGTWATGGNLFATTNPFVATPRARGQTLPGDFALSSTSTALNRLGSLAPRTALAKDYAMRCRSGTGTGTLDAGAWETGATDCSGAAPPPTPVCGNGALESGEACDDGNTASGDGCSATCTVEPVCGNGTREGAEACDDGNRSNGDGCSATCTLEPVCGNGTREGAEACDDGNRTSGDGCSATCTIEACGNGVREGAEQCDDGNRTSGDGCSSTCTSEAVCGNGVREGTEQCDDGNRTSGDGCSATCTIEPVCGNGAREGSEACDDGNRTSGDGCSSTCTIEPVCGNGTREGSEACDDGNRTNGDGCSSTCTIEPVCGNGTREGAEACDDGNRTSGDGCSATCTVETAWCGNGQVDAGEACDDGNRVGGDGCRENCTIERCGDGIRDGAEQCDDGDTTSGDGCSATCTSEAASWQGVSIDVGATDPVWVDPNGYTWVSDLPFVNGGRVYNVPADIRGTVLDRLYWSRRYGWFGNTIAPVVFEIPIPAPGSHRVRLHFAEVGNEIYADGQRVFDVSIEDVVLYPNLDIYRLAGRERAFAKDFWVHVPDGSLTITLIPRVNVPSIAAIEVYPEDGPMPAPRFVDRCNPNRQTCQ